MSFVFRTLVFLAQNPKMHLLSSQVNMHCVYVDLQDEKSTPNGKAGKHFSGKSFLNYCIK